jgi:phosphoglycolate phosphatase
MPLPATVTSITLDLDGTLLDTIDDLAAAANAMLADFRLPLRSRDEVQGFVGRGIADLVQRCLPEGCGEPARSNALPVFRRHYAAHNGRQARLYPGVREGLQALKAQGFSLAVVTNKAKAFSEPLLVLTGLAPYFTCTVSGDSLPQRKPHPAPLLHAIHELGSTPATNLHIGDSAHDADCARAAGSPVALVPYGYSGPEGVRNLDCDVIFESLTELASALASSRIAL